MKPSAVETAVGRGARQAVRAEHGETTRKGAHRCTTSCSRRGVSGLDGWGQLGRQAHERRRTAGSSLPEGERERGRREASWPWFKSKVGRSGGKRKVKKQEEVDEESGGRKRPAVGRRRGETASPVSAGPSLNMVTFGLGGASEEKGRAERRADRFGGTKGLKRGAPASVPAAELPDLLLQEKTGRNCSRKLMNVELDRLSACLSMAW